MQHNSSRGFLAVERGVRPTEGGGRSQRSRLAVPYLHSIDKSHADLDAATDEHTLVSKRAAIYSFTTGSMPHGGECDRTLCALSTTTTTSHSQ